MCTFIGHSDFLIHVIRIEFKEQLLFDFLMRIKQQKCWNFKEQIQIESDFPHAKKKIKHAVNFENWALCRQRVNNLTTEEKQIHGYNHWFT